MKKLNDYTKLTPLHFIYGLIINMLRLSDYLLQIFSFSIKRRFKLLLLLKSISLSVIFFSVSFLQAQNGFTLTAGPGNSSFFQGYCDQIPFTLQITNDGTSSAFVVRIAPEDIEFDYVDFGNLPDDDPELEGDYDVIEFETPVLADNESASYNYSMIATTWSTGGIYTFVVRVTKISNSTPGTHTYDFGPAENFNANLNSYVYASDIIDDYSQNPALLPLTGISLPACDPSSTQRIYVPDKIIFDIPEYCIYNNEANGVIVMGAGAELIVENGSTLTLNDALVKSCDKMWKGFYVKKGGRLILNDCVIENAQYGIRAERGASIASYRSTFLNNYIGVYVSPIQYGSSPEEPDDSYVVFEGFYNNLFIGSGELFPPYSGQTPTPESKPYAGIKASYLSVLDLPGYVSPDDYANYFENLSNGILLDHSSLRMADAFFKDITADPEINAPIQGYGIRISEGKYAKINGNSVGVSSPNYDYHFENCDIGVYNDKGAIEVSGITMNAVNTGIELTTIKNRKITVDDNTIKASDIGVLLNQCWPTEGNVTNNFIEVSGDGDASSCLEINDPPLPTLWNVENNYIMVGDARYGILNRAGHQNAIMNNTIAVEPYTEDDAFGIYLDGIKGPQVTCNDLTGDIEPEVSNFHGSTGIFFEGANTFNITCNEVTDFRYGIKASSQNTGEGLLRGNTFGDLWQGLFLGSTSIIGPQDHHGNIWDGEYFDYAAVHEGTTNALIQKSRFLFDTDDNLLFEPPSISAAYTWFTDEVGTSFFCNEEEICPEGIGYYSQLAAWDSLDLDVIAGNLGFEYFDNPLSWMSRFHTFRRLKGVSSILLPTPINTFLNTQKNLNIGKFSNAYDSLAISLKYTGGMLNVLEAFPTDMSGFYNHIHKLDTLLMEDRNNDSLISVLKLVYDSIYLLECNFLYKDSLISEILDFHLDNAVTYITAINPDSSWEEHLQFTLLEFLDYAKNDTLTSSSDLFDLAMICPDRYGDPVYHARSLIRMDSTNRYYDNDGMCAYINPRSVLPTFLPSIQISPNPASEEIVIASSEEMVKIDLIDISGILHPVSYQNDGYFARCETSILNAGIYFVKIQFRGGKNSTHKVVISKS
jgi:hypothetical protein